MTELSDSETGIEPTARNKPLLVMIAGTSRSGSTVTDVMLGSSPQAFSCGEIYAWFRPWRRHHLELRCHCGRPRCDKWSVIAREPQRRFHRAIVDNLGVDVVVDSSKYLAWIIRTAGPATRAGMDGVVVITWKNPRNLAYSFFKREGTDESIHGAVRRFLTYYTSVFEVGLPLVAVSNEALQEDPGSLISELSTVLGIPYDSLQEEFWNVEQHHLFGSDTVVKQLDAKTSTFDQDTSEEFDRRWAELGYEDSAELAAVAERLRSIDVSTMTDYASLPMGARSLSVFRQPLWFYKYEVATTLRRLKFHLQSRAVRRSYG